MLYIFLELITNRYLVVVVVVLPLRLIVLNSISSLGAKT